MAFRYNAVTFHLPRTLGYKLEVERDPSFTDVLWNVHTIHQLGYVVTDQGRFPLVNPSDITCASEYAQVKEKLLQPRRELLYTIGGVSMVEVGQGVNRSLDAKLGPEPVYADVREIADGMFRVEFVVKVYNVRCDNTCADLDPVVSLRWSQTEWFDDNWYSHLETDGLLIVRSDMLQSADNFRHLATPPILRDYRRTESRYRLSENGTRLQFLFRDTEVDRLPPYPATKAGGLYVVNVGKGGSVRTGQCSVSLEGPKGTSRAQLLAVATNMCFSKLRGGGLTNPKTPIVLGARFAEDLFSPKVEVSMQMMLSPLGSKLAIGLATATAGAVAGLVGAGGAAATVDVTPPQFMPNADIPAPGTGSDRTGLAPAERKRLMSLLTAAFRDPCLCQTIDTKMTTSPGSKGQGNPEMRELKGAPAVPPAVIEISSDPLTAPRAVTPIKDEAPYDEYEVEASYDFDSGEVPLPSPGTGSAAGVATTAKVHGGQLFMVVCFVACRRGLPPVLPSFQSPNSNFRALKGSLVARHVEMSADQVNPTHMVAGYYRYLALDPSKVQIAAPVPPFLSDTAGEAGKVAGGYYTEAVLWKFTPQSGANPFASGGVALDQAPDSKVADALMQGVVGAGVEVGNAVLNVLGLPGALGTTGSGGGSGSNAEPPVNP